MTSNTPIWDDHPWQPLPALRGTARADVCVVGLGGSGLAAVTALLARGARVVGLDAGSVGGGAAGRNGGFLMAGMAAFYHDAVRQHGRRAAAELYAATRATLAVMRAETPDAIRQTGSLRVGADLAEEQDCAAQLAALRADGFPAEPYEGPEGRGLLITDDCAFQPLLRCRTLARRALAAGAQLYEQSRAVTISGDTVATDGGSVACRAAIVAVDGNLELVLPELVGTVRTARLQMLGTAPAPEVSVPRPVYARWGYTYWQQRSDQSIALGGFRDLFADAEWTSAATPSAPVQAVLDAYLRDTLGVSAAVTHRWAASVSFTRDGLPLLAQVRPGVWAVGAYSGTGNVMGALYGRRAAGLALEG